MRQHGLFGVLAGGVHQAQRVDGAGRAGHGVRAAAFAGHRRPGLGLGAFKGIDATPVGAAVGVPDGGIGTQPAECGMKGNRRVHVVVVALGGMDGLGATNLLRRLAHELEGALDAMFFHRGLGRQHARQRAQSKGGMRIRVTRRPTVHAVAGFLVGHAVLAVAGHRIVFRIRTDGGAAIAPAGTERGRHAATPGLDLEAFCLQTFDVPGRGPVLPPGRLMKIPYGVVPRRQRAAMLVDPGEGGLLL